LKKFKIVHLDSEMTWRGGQKQVLGLVRGLNARGYDNTIICRKDSELAKRAINAGVKVLTLPMKSELDLLSAWELRRYIKSESINIVHAHSAHAHSVGMIAAASVKGCRFVVTRRVDFHLNNFFSKKIKYGLKVDKILCVSDAIKRILIDDGINPRKLITVRSGFVPGVLGSPLKNMELRRSLGIDDKSIVVSTVAALAPHKALHVLVKAASLVAKKRDDVVFLVAGEGEMRLCLEADIKNLGLKGIFHLLGFVDDVETIYSSSDIFAISSEEEGLCTSLFDAMYFRLPIVATSAGGIPEIVLDEVNGYIVPVNDSESFAKRILTLAEDNCKREKMGLKALEVLEANSIDKTVEKTIEVYNGLY
jgi:L-malate glycosyltransferase